MSTQRVDSDDVQEIFPTTLELQPFIETATLIVTERLVGHYTEARLREIERWLTAHLASTSGSVTQGGGEVSSIRADEISVNFSTSTVASTRSRFGDHVKLLDFKGILFNDMQAKPASFSVH